MTTMPPGGRTALNLAIDHDNGIVKTTPRLRAQLEKLGYITREGRTWKVTTKGVEAVRPPTHQPGDRVTTPDGPGTVRSVDQFASGTRYEVALDTPLPGQRAVQRYTPNQLAAEPSQPLARATCTSTWTRYGETHQCDRPAGHPVAYHRSAAGAYWLGEAATASSGVTSETPTASGELMGENYTHTNPDGSTIEITGRSLVVSNYPEALAVHLPTGSDGVEFARAIIAAARDAELPDVAIVDLSSAATTNNKTVVTRDGTHFNVSVRGDSAPLRIAYEDAEDLVAALLLELRTRAAVAALVRDLKVGKLASATHDRLCESPGFYEDCRTCQDYARVAVEAVEHLNF